MKIKVNKYLKKLYIEENQKMENNSMNDHAHIHVYMDTELHERIIAFRFEHKVKTKNEAVIKLIEAGLKHLDSENEPNENNLKG